MTPKGLNSIAIAVLIAVMVPASVAMAVTRVITGTANFGTGTNGEIVIIDSVGVVTVDQDLAAVTIDSIIIQRGGVLIINAAARDNFNAATQIQAGSYLGQNGPDASPAEIRLVPNAAMDVIAAAGISVENNHDLLFTHPSGAFACTISSPIHLLGARSRVRVDDGDVNTAFTITSLTNTAAIDTTAGYGFTLVDFNTGAVTITTTTITDMMNFNVTAGTLTLTICNVGASDTVIVHAANGTSVSQLTLNSNNASAIISTLGSGALTTLNVAADIDSPTVIMRNGNITTLAANPNTVQKAINIRTQLGGTIGTHDMVANETLHLTSNGTKILTVTNGIDLNHSTNRIVFEGAGLTVSKIDVDANITDGASKGLDVNANATVSSITHTAGAGDLTIDVATGVTLTNPGVWALGDNTLTIRGAGTITASHSDGLNLNDAASILIFEGTTLISEVSNTTATSNIDFNQNGQIQVLTNTGANLTITVGANGGTIWSGPTMTGQTLMLDGAGRLFASGGVNLGASGILANSAATTVSKLSITGNAAQINPGANLTVEDSIRITGGYLLLMTSSAAAIVRSPGIAMGTAGTTLTLDGSTGGMNINRVVNTVDNAATNKGIVFANTGVIVDTLIMTEDLNIKASAVGTIRNAISVTDTDDVWIEGTANMTARVTLAGTNTAVRFRSGTTASIDKVTTTANIVPSANNGILFDGGTVDTLNISGGDLSINVGSYGGTISSDVSIGAGKLSLFGSGLLTTTGSITLANATSVLDFRSGINVQNVFVMADITDGPNAGIIFNATGASIINLTSSKNVTINANSNCTIGTGPSIPTGKTLTIRGNGNVTTSATVATLNAGDARVHLMGHGTVARLNVGANATVASTNGIQFDSAATVTYIDITGTDKVVISAGAGGTITNALTVNADSVFLYGTGTLTTPDGIVLNNAGAVLSLNSPVTANKIISNNSSAQIIANSNSTVNTLQFGNNQGVTVGVKDASILTITNPFIVPDGAQVHLLTGTVYDGTSRIFSIPGNTPPTASFLISPSTGNVNTAFQVDASNSSDSIDQDSTLQVRWDWDNNGVWDTEYSTAKMASHQYAVPGTYTIKLEVKNTQGMTSTTTKSVTVLSQSGSRIIAGTANFGAGTNGEVVIIDSTAIVTIDQDISAVAIDSIIILRGGVLIINDATNDGFNAATQIVAGSFLNQDGSDTNPAELRLIPDGVMDVSGAAEISAINGQDLLITHPSGAFNITISSPLKLLGRYSKIRVDDGDVHTSCTIASLTNGATPIDTTGGYGFTLVDQNTGAVTITTTTINDMMNFNVNAGTLTLTTANIGASDTAIVHAANGANVSQLTLNGSNAAAIISTIGTGALTTLNVTADIDSPTVIIRNGNITTLAANSNAAEKAINIYTQLGGTISTHDMIANETLHLTSNGTKMLTVTNGIDINHASNRIVFEGAGLTISKIDVDANVTGGASKGLDVNANVTVNSITHSAGAGDLTIDVASGVTLTTSGAWQLGDNTLTIRGAGTITASSTDGLQLNDAASILQFEGTALFTKVTNNTAASNIDFNQNGQIQVLTNTGANLTITVGPNGGTIWSGPTITGQTLTLDGAGRLFASSGVNIGAGGTMVNSVATTISKVSVTGTGATLSPGANLTLEDSLRINGAYDLQINASVPSVIRTPGIALNNAGTVLSFNSPVTVNRVVSSSSSAQILANANTTIDTLLFKNSQGVTIGVSGASLLSITNPFSLPPGAVLTTLGTTTYNVVTRTFSNITNATISFDATKGLSTYAPNNTDAGVTTLQNILPNNQIVVEVWLNGVTNLTQYNVYIQYDPTYVQRINFSSIGLTGTEVLSEIAPTVYNITQKNAPIVFGNILKIPDSFQKTTIAQDATPNADWNVTAGYYALDVANSYVPSITDTSKMPDGKGLVCILAFQVKSAFTSNKTTAISVSKLQWRNNTTDVTETTFGTTLTIQAPSQGAVAPVIAAIANQFISINTLWTYQVQATDANNDTMMYAITGPAGMTISNTGLISWTPTASDTGAVKAVQIIVTDKSTAALKDTVNFTVVTILSKVTIKTAPGTYQVMVDGHRYSSPAVFTNWSTGSVHSVGADTIGTQATDNRQAFQRWNDSGAQLHTITVPPHDTTFTATYETEYRVSITVVPDSGGAIVLEPSGGWYGNGTHVIIHAHPDSGYYFSGFTGVVNGSDTTIMVTVNGPKTITAHFNVFQPVTISSTPSGRTVRIDGHSYTTPVVFTDWRPGSTHAIAVDSVQNGNEGVRYRYKSWSDGGGISHTITTPANAASYTVTCRTEYHISLTVNPAAGGNVTLSPSGEWYTDGSNVLITATTLSGYYFSGFSGDITDIDSSRTILMNGPKSIIANFALITYSVSWPEHASTTTNMSVAITSSTTVTVNGRPITFGDMISVWSAETNAYGGRLIWTGGASALTVWGDDEATTQVIDGLRPGETLRWAIYDVSTGDSLWARPVYAQGTGLFSINGLAVLSSLTADSSVTGEIAISLNTGWNMISSNVAPGQANVSSVLQPIAQQVAIMKDGQGKVYWPEFNINQIGNWSIGAGYLIKVAQPCTLAIQGQAVNTDETPITLNAGWSMISYLPQTPLSPATAFGAIAGQVVIVKNGTGQVYWPEFGINQIGALQPGAGYLINVSAPVALTYPAGGSAKRSGLDDPGITALPSKQRFTVSQRTDNSSTVLIQFRQSQDTMLPDGAEVAAVLPDGRVIGASVIEQNTAVLTVWGDDSYTPVIDGIEEGAPYRFILYDPQTSETRALDVAVQTGSVEYQANDVVVMTATYQLEFVPTSSVLQQNYPNPFNPETAIQFAIPENSHVLLEIYNIQGRLVRTLVETLLPAGNHRIIWDGRNNLGQQAASGLYIYRLKTDTVTMTKKMLLVR